MFKNMKFVYLIGFILITILGLYYYQDIIFSKPNDAPKPVSSIEKTIERKFNVQGMYCESCKNKIETAVLKLNGVKNVNVDQSTNEMVVTYLVTNESIQDTLSTVKDLGYTIGLKSQSGKLQVLDFNVTFQ